MYTNAKITIDGKELTKDQCRAIASAVEGYHTELKKSEDEILRSSRGLNKQLKTPIAEVRALLNDLHEL